MADRYWVGFSGGNWSNAANWSTSSGGAGGASVPTSADKALFPSTAITSAGKIITVDVASSCLDIDFTGMLNAPTFAMSAALSIFGSATFIAAMTITGNSNFLFSATTTGKTITTNGLNISMIIILQGVGGGWTLQDNYSGNFISHIAGTFDTNSKTVTLTNGLNSTGNTARTLNLGASVITITGAGAITMVATGLTLNAGTSIINMVGNSSTFDGAGLTYYNINLIGSPVTIIGNNTYNIRTVSPGVTVNNTAGSNQTAASFVDNGTPALAITEQSTVAGTPFTLTKTSGAVIFRHVSIKDCTATGGATFSALESSVNVSGNTGITFGVARTFMQIKPNGTYEALYFEDGNGVLQNLTMQNSNAMRQVIINGNFSINQRGASGTVTLAAGAYGHDRWKAGASGCTYTFVTVNNITTITITSGSLIQVIEGINLFSGTYVLSWTGTSQGRVGTGNYSASSITTSIIGGINLNVEFGVGTLSKVQFNAGDTALPFQPRDYEEELRKSLRFNRRLSGSSIVAFGTGFAFSTTQAAIFIPISRMRVVPTMTTIGSLRLINSVGNGITVTAISLDSGQSSADGAYFIITVASGLVAGNGTALLANSDTTAYINLDAEL